MPLFFFHGLNSARFHKNLPLASEVALIDFLIWKGSLTLLAFPPVNLWLPLLHAELCLYWSHHIIYLLIKVLFSKIPSQRIDNWNKDPQIWNLKGGLERKAGVLGVTCCIVILTPFHSELPFCELSFGSLLSIQRTSFAQNPGKLPVTVTEWLIWTLIIFQVSIKILLYLKDVLSPIN